MISIILLQGFHPLTPGKGSALDPVYPRFTRIIGRATVALQYPSAWPDGEGNEDADAFIHTENTKPCLLQKAVNKIIHPQLAQKGADARKQGWQGAELTVRK